ncbi:MAG: hypothetical protein AB7K09_07295 [Planctomycetota bacterium]
MRLLPILSPADLVRRVALVGLSVATLAACVACTAAPKLDSRIDNLELPNEFRSRWLLATPGTFGDHLQDLIGRVVVVRDATDGRGAEPDQPGHTVRKSDFVEIADIQGADRIRIVTDSKMVYSSKIDSKFSASLEVPSFTGNMAANQVQHVTISDVARAWLDDRACLRELLRRLACLKHEPGEQYFLITGVVLSHVQRQVFVETSADSSISGTVFGANGKVYASDDRTSCEAMIFLDCFPIRTNLREQLTEAGVEVARAREIELSEMAKDTAMSSMGQLPGSEARELDAIDTLITRARSAAVKSVDSESIPTPTHTAMRVLNVGD